MPGPHEPNTEQLNNCIEADVRELKQLKRGKLSILFDVDICTVIGYRHKNGNTWPTSRRGICRLYLCQL
jgi:hypothetical protein